MTIFNIKCDKCGGRVIEHVDTPPVEHRDITMKDYIDMRMLHSFENPVYFYTHYKLLCTECGHIARYHK